MNRKRQRRPARGGAAATFSGENCRSNSATVGQSEAQRRAPEDCGEYQGELKAFLDALGEAGPGTPGFLVEVYPALQALAHPLYGMATLDLFREAMRSAAGANTSECFTCCRPWLPSRAIAAVLVAQMVNTKHGLIAGICPDCGTSPVLTKHIGSAMERDFGVNSEPRVVHSTAGQA